MTPFSPEDGRVVKDVDLRDLLTAMGIVAGLWALAKLVLKPVVRALWREVHADEVKKWDDMARLTESHKDQLVFIVASVKEQGAALKAMSRDLNQVIGRLEGPPWDGRTERRQDIRRQEDEERSA